MKPPYSLYECTFRLKRIRVLQARNKHYFLAQDVVVAAGLPQGIPMPDFTSLVPPSEQITLPIQEVKQVREPVWLTPEGVVNFLKRTRQPLDREAFLEWFQDGAAAFNPWTTFREDDDPDLLDRHYADLNFVLAVVKEGLSRHVLEGVMEDGGLDFLYAHLAKIRNVVFEAAGDPDQAFVEDHMEVFANLADNKVRTSMNISHPCVPGINATFRLNESKLEPDA